MAMWNRLGLWVGAVLQRSRLEREMDAELSFHIEARAEPRPTPYHGLVRVAGPLLDPTRAGAGAKA